MREPDLLLGIDGGGTGCRARLCAGDGAVLGEGAGGPANLRFGIAETMASVLAAAHGALQAAGLRPEALARVAAGMGLAGASEPALAAAARAHPLPFARSCIVTDAAIACRGAHAGADGGIVIVGTGTIGWAILHGREHRVGGWGHPLSDEGSGAWIGAEAARLALRAHDGRAAPSVLTEAVLTRFEGDPHRIVAWMTAAKPRDVATIAPLVVEAAAAGDAGAIGILRAAGAHVAELAERLVALGAERIALLGGLASPLDPYLPAALRPRLAAPRGSALDGALSLARTLAPDHPGAPMR